MKKPTRWMSNSADVLKALEQRCAGRGGACSMGGHHRLASGGRARAAAVYPFQLCKAILRGFRNQLRSDGRQIQGIYGLQSPEWEEARVIHWDELPDDVARAVRWDELPEATPMKNDQSAAPTCSPKRLQEVGAGQCKRPKTEEQEMCAAFNRADMKSQRCQENFKDAITGQSLDPALTKEARKKELEYFASKGVWHKRPRSEAYKFTGKPPISVKWVDVNKGDDEAPNYRSRLVAREIRQA